MPPVRRRTSLAVLLGLGTTTALAVLGAAPAVPQAVVTGIDPRLITTPQAPELGALEPGDPLEMQRGVVRPADYARAMAQADAAPVAAANWHNEGPTNIGGRVLDVVVDPTLKDTVYAAAASGGVWQSTDAGKTFHSVWPDHYTQAIGALAMSPSGVLYAGTGEAGPGGGSITYAGNGVYRSTDRGKTWQHVGLPDSGRIGRIAVDPADDRRVFVAATGNLYQAGGERGLYLSTDGGDSWKQALKGENETTGAADVAVDPADPKNVLVTMWDNHREPDRRFYTGLGSGIFRSTDAGATWTRVGLPFFAADPALGRIGVAYAPTKAGRVYAITSTEVGAFAGFYVSDDGGVTYTPRAGVPLVTGAFVYGWWFGRLYVDPDEPDHVYAPGVNLSETTDAGTNWGSAGVGQMHADSHGMAWDPKAEGRVYVGDDGGVWISSDDGGGEWQKSEYQPFNQLYGIDVDERDARRMTAGLQDNGVVRSWDPDGEFGPGNWSRWIGGDGEKSLINPQDGQIMYGCSQYGACAVSTNGGDSSTSWENDIVASRKNWFMPIEFDPLNPSTVYTGGESLWRSDDDGKSWNRIGGTTADFSNGPGREPNPLFLNYGTITTIAVTDTDRGHVVVGTDDGNLWTSTDAGATFAKVTASGLPKAWITRVAIDLKHPDEIYATYSGYRQADNKAHVFRSTDFGKTWTDVTGNLPTAPVNDVIVVGDDLLVATDVGVFLSHDHGASWLAVGRNLPRAPVNDIRYHAKTHRVYAATFGRGAYWTPYPGAAAVPPPAPAPEPAPKPRPAPKPKPLPATGLPAELPLLALLAGGAAVTLRRRAGATRA